MAVFTVTNLSDAAPGSLRAAINAADAASSPSTINFATSGTITLAGALPSLTEGVLIDGTSAPGYAGAGPVVTLNANGFPGLVLAAGSGGSELLALSVINSSGYGVTLQDSPETIAASSIVSASGGVYATAASGQIIGTSGVISGGTSGINIATGGAVLNNAGSVAGAASYGVLLRHGGTVANQTGGVIQGGEYGVRINNAAGTIINSGSIGTLRQPTEAINPDGVYLTAGGAVTNLSTGVIAGSSEGIRFATAVVNSGTIIGGRLAIDGGTDAANSLYINNLFGGTIIGGASGAIDDLFGTVVNDGLITASSQGAGFLLGTGAVTNQSNGTIAGVQLVQFEQSGDRLVNAGMVSASIEFYGAGTVTNTSHGTIIGNLVASGSRFITPSLTLSNAGTIAGTVNAASVLAYPGATFSSFVYSPVLELASGASAGTMAGLGSRYVVTDVSVDPGANWNLDGNANSLAAGVVLTNGGTLSIAGVLDLDGGNLVNGGSLVNDGTIVLQTGTLTVGEFSGNGTIVFAGANEIVSFTSATATDNVVAGFSGGETIEIAGQTIAAASFLNTNTLQVDLLSGGTLDITLDASQNYAADVLQSFNNGGNGFVTAEHEPPSLSGVVAAQAVAAGEPMTPFASAMIGDSNFAPSDTVSVTLANPTLGVLSDSQGGVYNSADGVFTDTASPGVATTVLQSLTFTPAASTNGFVSSGSLTLDVSNSYGTATPASSTIVAVTQVLSLASASPIAISTSPDGSSFAKAQPDVTNEAVLPTPTQDGVYGLPTGYQAEFLGGNANAVLLDSTISNAILAGNSGNDTIAATASGDSVIDGHGANLLFGGADVLVSSNGSNDTVSALGDGTSVQSAGADALVFGTFGSAAGALSVALGGAQATLSAGQSTTAITASGGDALVFGGFVSPAGSLNLADTGRGDTVSAGNSAITATLSGSDALVFGGYGNAPGGLNITDSGSGDTIVAGNSAATVTGGSNGTFVWGGSGTLNFAGGTGQATVVAGVGGATVSAGSGGAMLFGGAGADMTATGADPLLFVAAGGNETLNAASASGANTLVGGSAASSADVMIGGSGNDLLFAGAGADTLVGGAGANIFSFVSSLTHGGVDVIADFSGGDRAFLTGYGANEAASVLNAAVSSGGNTTITLSDNTQIVFLGIASVSALEGHVFSS